MTLAARDPNSVKTRAAVQASGAPARPIAQAVAGAEVILLATPWDAVEDALRAAGPLAGKVLLDATNPLKPQLAGLTHGRDTSGAEHVAMLAPGAKVVKVFNTIGAQHLSDGKGVTMFLCGDDSDARKAAAQLAQDVGFEPMDVGSLKEARLLEPLALLWITLAYRRGLGHSFALSILRW